MLETRRRVRCGVLYEVTAERSPCGAAGADLEACRSQVNPGFDQADMPTLVTGYLDFFADATLAGSMVSITASRPSRWCHRDGKPSEWSSTLRRPRDSGSGTFSKTPRSTSPSREVPSWNGGHRIEHSAGIIDFDLDKHVTRVKIILHSPPETLAQHDFRLRAQTNPGMDCPSPASGVCAALRPTWT